MKNVSFLLTGSCAALLYAKSQIHNDFIPNRMSSGGGSMKGALFGEYEEDGCDEPPPILC